jgi:hypothetical protein
MYDEYHQFHGMAKLSNHTNDSDNATNKARYAKPQQNIASSDGQSLKISVIPRKCERVRRSFSSFNAQFTDEAWL